MTIWTPSIVDGECGRPLYLSIAQAIEADVLAGRLQPGDRLPPHRDLAARIGVTVGTVSRGYAEAHRAGWISGEVGRGTFVLDRLAGRFPSRREEDGGAIDLSLNVPIESPAPDLAAALRALAGMDGVQSLLRYAPTRGPHNDRVAGATVLERHGLAVDPERVVLCAGAQHGVGVALEAVSRPGDCILAEELTYPAFRPLAEARGLRIHPVALDEQGIVPEALRVACRKARPKALYVIPTLHNPTTGSLSIERREALAEIAGRHDLIVIEDDIHRMLAPESPPPIAHFAPERTIYVASLSKTLAPGLRVGYLVAPPAFHDRLASAVWRSLWMLSPVATALATHWVLGGEFDAIAAAKRREAAARQALAAKILPRARVRTARTAYHLWLATGAVWTAEAFTLQARARGVLVTPATAFHLGSGPSPAAVRVSLSAAADRSVLVTALERLRKVLDGEATSLSTSL
jgi:DNA-binding transcriptional MocR family regulator